jgi:glycosyltransferase involved in cell wall biosynthesis
MWTVLLWAGAVLWIYFFLQLLVNRLCFIDLSRRFPKEPDSRPLISIVVPARDEEKKIREAVTSFCTQDYPEFEVIVVDDRSTDATPAILAELRSRFPNLTVVHGKEPPPGWLGKPHALQQGLERARGEWVLFVDADVVYSPDLLRRAVAYALEEKASMLFLMPCIEARGVVEASLMSALFFLGAAILPSFLATRSRLKGIALGAGVFNMVRRKALDACGVFEGMKDMVVDDVGLGFRIKRGGFKLAGALAGPMIRIRMYEGAGDTVRGFTKNIYPALRSFPWFIPLLFPFAMIISILPYLGFGLGLVEGRFCLPAALSLVLMHATFAGIALIFHQPWHIVFTNPLRELGWCWIVARSAWMYHTKGIVWRGRTYGKGP